MKFECGDGCGKCESFIVEFLRRMGSNGGVSGIRFGGCYGYRSVESCYIDSGFPISLDKT